MLPSENPIQSHASEEASPRRTTLDPEILAAEVGAWVHDGLLSSDQAARILARYRDGGDGSTPLPSSSPAPATQGAVASVLYGVASVLLGASGLTFVLVLSPRADPDPFHFFALGVGLGLLGFGLRAWAKGPGPRPRFPDAIWQTVLTGALLPISAAALAAADDPTALPFAGAALIAALALLRGLRRVHFTSPIAVAAAAVVAALGVGVWVGQGDLQFWAIAGAHLFLVGLTVRILGGAEGSGNRMTGGELGGAHPVSVALAVGAFAVSLWAAVNQIFGFRGAEWSLLAVGAVMAGGALLGLRLRELGLVLGSGVALAVCGIGFAFTVGGLLVGTGVLTATAILLIWKAGSLLAR